MIKSALEYLVRLKPVEQLVIGNRQYTDRRIEPVLGPLAETLELETLTGVRDYISSNLDGVRAERVMLHVEDFQTVSIIGPIDGDFRQREILIRAKAHNCSFPFDRYLERESFHVGLLSSFAQTESRDMVLRYISGIKQTAEIKTTDDGISQRVTARVGIARVAEVDLPNPVLLKPFRTFTEAEQPESAFIFRVRNHENDTDKPAIAVGLFEADGGAWRLQAAENIKRWLVDNIPGARIIV